ncbi:ricin-type beta-trefoil lectin domain protein [Ceratobasidium sp. AG-Ba]|nr:ricin-type beta-trefoil lectin domain protein [Ceratobasidium sp. AG-Ba]
MSDFPSVFRIQHVASGSFMTVSETTGNPVVGGQPAKTDKKSHFQLVPVFSGGYKLKNIASGQEVHFDAARNGMLFAATTGSVFFIRKESNSQFAIHVNRSPNYVVDLEQANMLDENLYAIRLVQEKNAKSPLWTLGNVEEEKPNPPPVCYPFAPGIYVIRNVKTGTVMDLEGAVDGEGVNIQGHQANNGANQRWHVMPSGNGSNMSIQNVATDEYAAYPRYEQEATLTSSFRAAEYQITAADKGFYIAPVELPTHVVDLTKGLEADRTPICLWVKHTEDHQKWYFERSL